MKDHLESLLEAVRSMDRKKPGMSKSLSSLGFHKSSASIHPQEWLLVAPRHLGRGRLMSRVNLNVRQIQPSTKRPHTNSLIRKSLFDKIVFFVIQVRPEINLRGPIVHGWPRADVTAGTTPTATGDRGGVVTVTTDGVEVI
jgi:hypothetical protein